MTDRQKQILLLLLDHEGTENGRCGYGLTGNQIGMAVCPHAPYVHGRDTRVFGPAQRVIGSLNGLSKRGYVRLAPRRDGLSGTAYGLTKSGREAADYLRGESKVSEYEMESVSLLRDGVDVPEFEVGETVSISEEHEVYPGETGVVLGVGRGQGFYAGEIVYDVLVEGTEVAERFGEGELV